MNGMFETICIRITNKCNLSCRHCWATSSKNSALFLEPSAILKFAFKFKKLGLKHISLSGGEPTLHPFLEVIIERLLREGFHVTITTNGIITNDHLAKLSKSIFFLLKNNLQFTWRISIDGWRDLHESIRGTGTYKKTTETAKQLNSYFGSICINTVVLADPYNIFSLVNDLRGINIKEWSLITPVPRGFLKESNFDKKTIFNRIEQWKIYLSSLNFIQKITVWDYISHPNGGLLIEPNGDVTMPGITESDDVLLGHLTEISTQCVGNAIKKRLEYDPVAYFTYEKI